MIFASKTMIKIFMAAVCSLLLGVIGGCARKGVKRGFHEGTPIFTEKKTILKLYQITKDVDEVLAHHNIPYWIDFGTLLGAVRHKGIIPWDDDVDICIEGKDEKAFVRLTAIFEKLGYGMVPMFFGYKLFYLDGVHVENVDGVYNFPSLDIFIREWKGSKLYYVTRKRKKRMIWAYRDGKEIYSTFNEIYPLKKYTFGEMVVSGPHKPEPGLTYNFGNDWFEVAYQSFLHETTKMVKKVKMKLTDIDRVPALPTGPLFNRIR